MNLHAIVGPVVAAVNPWLQASYLSSSGWAAGLGGTRTPTYAEPLGAQVQMQPISGKDLEQLSGLNINTAQRAMYVTGNWQAVSRPDFKGGDLIRMAASQVFPDGAEWLVVAELENWAATSGWCKVAVTRQVLKAC